MNRTQHLQWCKEIVTEPCCEAERRLGLSYINIASRGVKSHLGREINEDLVLLVYGTQKQSMAVLWSRDEGRALNSENLAFDVGMLWDWDWRAVQLEEVFNRLYPSVEIPVEPEASAPSL